MTATAPQPTTMPELERYVRQSVPIEYVRQWLAVQPKRAYRDLAGDWLIILTAFVLVAAMPTVWTYLVAFLLVGTSQYKLFILAHDAIHGALHPNRRVNDNLARWLVYGPMFMALEDARRNHLKHHRYMGTPDDPDRYLHTFAAKNSPLQFLLYCSGLATFGKTVLKVTPFGKLLEASNRDSQASETQTPKTPQTEALLGDYFQQRIPVLLWQPLLIAAIALSPLPVWAYLLLWVAPIFFLVFVPDEIRAFCDHAVLTYPDDTCDLERLISFCPPWWEAQIFSPHHMNYHAEHHLWPSMPHYHLAKAHRFVRDRSEITVRGSYIAFLWRVLRFLQSPVTSHQ
ncbi:fatty acid desaturase family protein [Baaleninema simplex]|uniref:fatty acid desaturase family protein n=1 Tax=Baaleninema simplex TaxID=2862350 RepID=UPI000349DFA4|nr:fatty acid desaturase family protein [Baaleninema simplex]